MKSVNVDKVLSQAQERTDRIQIAKFERQSKRRRQDIVPSSKSKSAKRVVPSKNKNKKTTSKFFSDTQDDLVVISSSEDEESGDKSPVKEWKRVCTRAIPTSENISCKENLDKVLRENILSEISPPNHIFLEEVPSKKSTYESLDPNPVPNSNDCEVVASNAPLDVTSEPGSGMPTPWNSQTDGGSSESDTDQITSQKADHFGADSDSDQITSQKAEHCGADSDSDTDLITDRSTNCLLFSVSAYTDRIYFYDYSGVYCDLV